MADELMIPGNPASNSDAVNEQALYSTIMYLPLNEMGLGKNDSLDVILQKAEKYIEKNPEMAADLQVQGNLDAIEEMITYGKKNYGLQPDKVTMNNPSWADPNACYGDPKGLLAASFANFCGRNHHGLPRHAGGRLAGSLKKALP